VYCCLDTGSFGHWVVKGQGFRDKPVVIGSGFMNTQGRSSALLECYSAKAVIQPRATLSIPAPH
jgi:hypothetical protein